MITKNIEGWNVTMQDNIAELFKSPLKSASIQREELERRLQRIEASLGIKTPIKSAAKETKKEPTWLRLERYNNGDFTLEEITPVEPKTKSASVEPKEPAWITFSKYGIV